MLTVNTIGINRVVISLILFFRFLFLLLILITFHSYLIVYSLSFLIFDLERSTVTLQDIFLFSISPNFSGGYEGNIDLIRFLIMETVTLLRCQIITLFQLSYLFTYYVSNHMHLLHFDSPLIFHP